MTTSEPTSKHPSLRITKLTAAIACAFLIPAVTLSPGLGSSLGMPWPVFFCTWGVMLAAAFISFIGYFRCKNRGERISVFYVICPSLLFIVFFTFLNLREIVRAFTL